MTDMQVVELEQTIENSVSSNTIEWALNMRICDMIQANPSLAPCLMRELVTHLRKETPVPVLLGLSLLEIVVKNCGFEAVRYIDERMGRTLVSLVKKREGWQYSLSRNLYKSVGGAFGGISQEEREMWVQASHKVREMLQLWADAFLLQEGRLRPIFDSYKRLRQEGYTFPQKEHGASAELCLIHGAEESPAFQAAGGGAGDLGAETDSSQAAATAAAAGAAAPQPLPAVASAAPAAAIASGVGKELQEAQRVLQELHELRRGSGADGRRCNELEQRVSSARDWATKLIQQHMEDGSGELEAERLQAVIVLLDELNELSPTAGNEASSGATDHAVDTVDIEAPQTDLLDVDGAAAATEPSNPAAGASSSSAAPLPPPPEDAPPDREQQELYDLILARYLQERENEAFAANEEEDAALALRLSLEEEGGGHLENLYPTPPRPPDRVACAHCGTVNQLGRTPTGGSSLFVCYGCGTTQLVPMPPVIGAAAPDMGASHRLAPSTASVADAHRQPTRHAPPPRVICAGGNAAELIIGGGAAAAEPPTLSSAAQAPPKLSKMQSFEGGTGREALLGAPVSNTGASLRSWMPSWPAGMAASAQSVKKLGDGAPESEYVAMNDEAAPLFNSDGNSAPPGGSLASSGLVSGLLSWKSRKKASEDTREPLLDRVRVNEEWELIRPADERPYWHNSLTQAPDRKSVV